MDITNFFSKTYCINLERRKDRWNECLLEFKNKELNNIERVSAVDGKDLMFFSQKVNSSALALILTNEKIFESAIENNYETILILEDDIEFTDQVKNISSFIEKLPENWDMIYFGGNHNTHVGHKAPESINEKVVKLHHTFSTHCIGINKKAYQPILDRIRKRDQPLDVIYSDLQKKLNVYSFVPAMATQRVSFSDIENKVTDYKWLIK